MSNPHRTEYRTPAQLAADNLARIALTSWPDHDLLVDADGLAIAVYYRPTGRVIRGRRVDHGRHLVHLGHGRGPARKVDAGELLLDAHGQPRPHRAVVEHLDGNPANNTLSNVRWGTVASNAAGPRRRPRRRDTVDYVTAAVLLAMGWRQEQVVEFAGAAKSTVSRWAAGDPVIGGALERFVAEAEARSRNERAVAA